MPVSILEVIPNRAVISLSKSEGTEPTIEQVQNTLGCAFCTLCTWGAKFSDVSPSEEAIQFYVKCGDLAKATTEEASEYAVCLKRAKQ